MADQQRSAQEEWHRDKAIIVTQSHNLILALRTNSLFCSKQRFGDFGKEGSHKLMTSIKTLRKDLLNTNQPLVHSRILQPFLEVSKSEETTGPITGVALSGLATFLEMKLSFVDVPTIIGIATAALEVKSEVADAQSHEAVLGRILQVLKACVCHPLGVCLPEDIILNILQGCFAIAMHGAPSELLRHTADATTNDMITHLYECVVRGTAPHCFERVFEFIVSMISTEAETLTRLLGPAYAPHSDPSDGSALPFKTQLAATKYAGLTLVYHSLATLKSCLTEERCKPLLTVIQNQLCRALLSVSSTMDNVVVIAQMLHTVQLAAMYCGDHIGPQLLAFLLGTYLKDDTPTDIQSMEIKEVILETLMEFCSIDSFPVFLVRTYDLNMGCPNVFEKLCKYLASQCYPTAVTMVPETGTTKLTSFNLCAFNTMLQLIRSVGSRCSSPPVLPSPEQRLLIEKKKSLQHFARLFLEKPKNAVKHLRSLEVGPDGRNIFGVKPNSNGHEIGRMLFENSPALDKRMLGEYISEGGLDPEYERHGREGETKEEFSMRLAEEADTKEGRVLYSSQVREGFIAQINFKGMHLVAALRLVLSTFLLPGEAQRIDRLMEEFATRWHQHNTPSDGIRDETVNPFYDSDAAFVFAFSVIMLNTDLHSAQVEQKMTPTGFKRNNRGTNGGKDIPPEYQELVFDDINDNEIKMKDAVTDIASEDFQWKQAVLKSRATGGTVGPISAVAVRDYDAHLFTTLVGHAISALSAVTEAVDEDTRRELPYGMDKSTGPVGGEVIINDAMHGFYLCGTMAAHFNNTGVVDKLVIALWKFTKILEPKAGPAAVTTLGRSSKGMLAIRALFNIVNDHGECMRDSWVEAMDLVLRIYLLGCLPEQQMQQLSPVNSITNSATFPNYVPSTHVAQSVASTASTVGSPTAAGPHTQSFYECPVSPIMSVKPYEKPIIEEEEKPASTWFSLGNTEEVKKRQQAQNQAAMSRVCRIISECKIAAIMEDRMRELSDEVIVWVVIALIKNSGVEIPQSDAGKDVGLTAHPSSVHTTVFSVHLLADLLVSNGHRYHVAAKHIDAFYTRLLVTAASYTCSQDANTNKQEVAYWIAVGEHVVVSMMRILVRLASEPGRTADRTRALLNGLTTFGKFHNKVFGLLVARHVASAFAIILKTDALDDVRDAEAWENLIMLTNKCGLLAKNGSITVQCFEILQSMAEKSSFAWPDNVPSLVQGLINLYHFFSTSSEDPDWEHVARPGTSPSGGVVEPVTLKVVSTLTRVRDTLISCSSSLKNPSPKWADAWLSILDGFAAVVASHTSPRLSQTADALPRERSDALIALQRSILAGETANLPVNVCYDAITKVLVELVKRLCGQENKAPVEEKGGLFGRFSPTMILGAALPDSPAPSTNKSGKENSVKGIDDLQTRVLALMCRAFLHFTENAKLASTPNEFVKAWRLILGLLFAYYTRPPPQSVKSDAGEAVKEAVCEQTKNMINVLASLPSPDLKAIPNFWPITHDLIVKISPALGQHLTLLGLPSSTQS